MKLINNIKTMEKYYKRLFSLVLLLMISLSSFGQDSCATATSLGTLPTPATCSFGSGGGGTPVVSNLTNIGATAANPYTYLVDCQGNAANDMASPADDVWYSFVASGNELDIAITGGITNPNVAIWEGTCGNLVGRGCNTGTGGNVSMSVTSTTPGST